MSFKNETYLSGLLKHSGLHDASSTIKDNDGAYM